jgi:copper chaperone
MVADAIPVSNHAIEELDELKRFDAQAGLFEQLADHACFERLADLKQAAGKRPVPFERLAPAAHQQDALIVDDNAADSDQRTLRKLSLHRAPSDHAALITIEPGKPLRDERRARAKRSGNLSPLHPFVCVFIEELETDARRFDAGEGMTMSEFTLRIENMHCGSCVRRVSGLLASAGGGSALEVKEVRIGAARVLSNGGAEPVQLALVALGNAGYPAHLEA